MDEKTKYILSKCDHTYLAQDAVWDDIKKICDDGLKYGTASVCIPPSFVKRAKDYVGDRLAICTVVGFPNGYTTSNAKQFETRDALNNGADEIDMVINVGALKEGRLDYVRDEIATLKKVCGQRILKVIIETCLLTEEEKITACRLVTEAGADFIKTSTGFSKYGATPEDVALLRKYSGPEVKVKAAGGISGLEDAAEYLALGAERLGTSRVVKAVKAAEAAETAPKANDSGSAY